MTNYDPDEDSGESNYEEGKNEEPEEKLHQQYMPTTTEGNLMTAGREEENAHMLSNFKSARGEKEFFENNGNEMQKIELRKKQS